MPRQSRHAKVAAPKAPRANIRRFLRDTFTFLVTVALVVALRSIVLPGIGPVTYVAKNQAPVTAAMPLFISSIADRMQMSVPLDLPRIHPTMFAIQVDDCVERLTVNGQRVIPGHQGVFCSPHDKTRINLGPWLMPGMNTLVMEISDIGVTEGIDIGVSRVDPLMLGMTIALLLAVTWYMFRLKALMVRRSPFSWIMIVFMVGLVVRLLYVQATPHTLREHDLGGHLDYIAFIRTHGHLPSAGEGWEFHQAPLYYLLSAGWMELGSRVFTLTDTALLQSLQAWSFFLSILTLGVALAAVRFLFSSRDRYGFLVFGLLLCVFPGLIFGASRITNEGLALFFTTSFIVMLLMWWHTPRLRWVVAMGALFALSFITKVSVLLLAPVAPLILLVRSGSLKLRLLRLALFCTVVVALAGWYPTLRLVVETNRTKTLSLGNVGMTHDLAVPRDFRHLFTFNPLAVVEHPFNNPWNDEERRGYLLEYFFRSSLFGEFSFKRLQWVTYPLIVSALLLIPCFLVGFFRELIVSFRRLLPLHLVTVCLSFGAFLYPVFFAYSSNQDFRFSVALCLPFAYYVTRGITVLPRRLREIAFGVCVAFITCSAIFTIGLFVQS